MSINVKMAWRNIWRNPRRTLLTIAAIAFACLTLVFMLSFQFGSYETMINASVKIHTGHLQIQAKGYQDKKSMRLVVSDPEWFGTLLEGMDGVVGTAFIDGSPKADHLHGHIGQHDRQRTRIIRIDAG